MKKQNVIKLAENTFYVKSTKEIIKFAGNTEFNNFKWYGNPFATDSANPSFFWPLFTVIIIIPLSVLLIGYSNG